MKRLMILSLMFLGIMFTATAWPHHPAEGIVSDDIWQMVDENLEGTPHLDLVDIMASMTEVTDSNDRPLLMTSAVVDSAYLDDYLVEINLVLDEINSIPSGATTSETASILEVVIVEDYPTVGETTISIFEPVGSGESQDDLTPKMGQ